MDGGQRQTYRIDRIARSGLTHRKILQPFERSSQHLEYRPVTGDTGRLIIVPPLQATHSVGACLPDLEMIVRRPADAMSGGDEQAVRRQEARTGRRVSDKQHADGSHQRNRAAIRTIRLADCRRTDLGKTLAFPGFCLARFAPFVAAASPNRVKTVRGGGAFGVGFTQPETWLGGADFLRGQAKFGHPVVALDLEPARQGANLGGERHEVDYVEHIAEIEDPPCLERRYQLDPLRLLGQRNHALLIEQDARNLEALAGPAINPGRKYDDRLIVGWQGFLHLLLLRLRVRCGPGKRQRQKQVSHACPLTPRMRASLSTCRAAYNDQMAMQCIDFIRARV